MVRCNATLGCTSSDDRKHTMWDLEDLVREPDREDASEFLIEGTDLLLR